MVFKVSGELWEPESFQKRKVSHSFFLTQARLRIAKREPKTFDANSTAASSVQTRSAASAWLRRVQNGNENLRRDLESDFVPAPDGSGIRWLLFHSKQTGVNQISGESSCKLCKLCRDALSRTSGTDGKHYFKGSFLLIVVAVAHSSRAHQPSRT